MLKVILQILGVVAGVVSAAKSTGVDVGNVGDFLLKEFDQYSATKANFESGQAALLANFTENGIAGVLVAVRVDGPAGAALGLSDPVVPAEAGAPVVTNVSPTVTSASVTQHPPAATAYNAADVDPKNNAYLNQPTISA